MEIGRRASSSARGMLTSSDAPALTRPPQFGASGPRVDRCGRSGPIRATVLEFPDTVDARAASPLGGGDHPVAALLGRSHPGLGQILASGRLAAHASTGRRAAAPSQPGIRTASRFLCTNMWMTCAQRRRACAYAVEILGIPLPARNHDRAFTCESASHILCIPRKSELSTCRAAIGNK